MITEISKIKHLYKFTKNETYSDLVFFSIKPPISEIKKPMKTELIKPPAILTGNDANFFDISIAWFASSMDSSWFASNIFCFAISNVLFMNSGSKNSVNITPYIVPIIPEINAIPTPTLSVSERETNPELSFLNW